MKTEKLSWGTIAGDRLAGGTFRLEDRGGNEVNFFMRQVKPSDGPQVVQGLGRYTYDDGINFEIEVPQADINMPQINCYWTSSYNIVGERTGNGYDMVISQNIFYGEPTNGANCDKYADSSSFYVEVR